MTLAELLAGVIVAALNAYVLFGGADFGGGVWDLLARGPQRARQRELVAHAIGPVWEANHVWLILAVVLLFGCFPPAFARLAIALHLPLTALLFGIVLRGSAFVFRSYGVRRDAAVRRWGRVFAVASLITPVLLGVSVGAVASGGVGTWSGAPGERFYAGYVEPWLTVFGFTVGLFTLACFAFLAAVYLTVEASDAALREDFRRRALGAGIAVFATAWPALGLARGSAPEIYAGLARAPWALALHLLIGAAALTAFAALWRRRYALARLAAAVQVSLILWGWALAQYPYLLPPNLTIDGGAAPVATLEVTLGALALGALVLFPSLYYLYRVFKGGDPASPAVAE